MHAGFGCREVWPEIDRRRAVRLCAATREAETNAAGQGHGCERCVRGCGSWHGTARGVLSSRAVTFERESERRESVFARV